MKLGARIPNIIFLPYINEIMVVIELNEKKGE